MAVQVGQPTWSVTTCTASRSPARPQHRRDEVAPVRRRTATRCARPRAAARRRAPGARRRAWSARRPSAGRSGRTRRRAAARRPRRAGVAVEHVVGRDVHERRRRPPPRRARGCRRRRALTARAARAWRLGAVDVGPGGAVDDRVGRARARARARTARSSVMSSSARVERRRSSWPARSPRAHDVAAEHPAGAGDEQPHRIEMSELSPDHEAVGARLALAAARPSRCARAARTPCARRGRRPCSRRAGSSARPPAPAITQPSPIAV